MSVYLQGAPIPKSEIVLCSLDKIHSYLPLPLFIEFCYWGHFLFGLFFLHHFITLHTPINLDFY